MTDNYYDNPTEPKVPLEQAPEVLWDNLMSTFKWSDEWMDYCYIRPESQKAVEDALASTGFYKLLEYVNAAAAMDSYFLNEAPRYIEYNDLVTRLRAAHKDLWEVPGVVLDPYHDEEMWRAVFSENTTLDGKE